MNSKEAINQGGVNGMGETPFAPETLAQLKAAIKAASERQSPQQLQENAVLTIKLRMLEQIQSRQIEEKVHPGEFLRELLDKLHIKQNRFATYLDLHPANLNAVLAGRRNISGNFALKLEQVFRIHAQLWMQLQFQHELQHLAAEEPQAQYSLADLLEE